MELASRIRWIAVIAGGLLFLVLIGWALLAIAQSIFDSGGPLQSDIAGFPFLIIGTTLFPNAL